MVYDSYNYRTIMYHNQIFVTISMVITIGVENTYEPISILVVGFIGIITTETLRLYLELSLLGLFIPSRYLEH